MGGCLTDMIYADIQVVLLTDPCENFDDLTVGGGVCEQLGGMWYTTWFPGNPCDAIVSDLYSVSPSNSMLVEGETDLILWFADENLTSGSYTFTHNIYIPTGRTGYWNLQKDVVIGIEWGFQIMYEDNMTAVIDAGGQAAAIVPYSYNTWYHNIIVVDLDNDWCKFYIDGELIIEYQWTLGVFGEPGANTLGSVNFYANPGAGGTLPGAHFDDVCFSSSSVGPFDPPINFSFDPVYYMLCWSPPYGGDSQRLVFETQNSRNLICYNIYINGSLVGTTTDLCWQLDNLTPGVYIFGVSAVYDGGESEIVEIEIIVPVGSFNPPTDFVVNNVGYGTWIAPDGESQKLVFVTRDLTYNVYLDGDLVGNTSNLFWDYTDLIDEQTYIAGVSALYGNGESDIVEYQFMFGYVGVSEILENTISVFPNPAKNNVNIQSDFNITDIVVYDYVGKVIYTIKNSNTKNVVLNTSSYGAGIYFVRIETKKGSTTKRIVISR